MSRVVVCLLCWGAALKAGNAAFTERQLQRTCGRCHSLDAIRARRLSREDWAGEVDKMTAMGARVRNRKALLDYLRSRYGENRRTENGEIDRRAH